MIYNFKREVNSPPPGTFPFGGLFIYPLNLGTN